MKVMNFLTVKRLNGEGYFKKKPVVSINNAPSHIGKGYVQISVELSGKKIEVDLSIEDVQRAIMNAQNSGES